MKRLALAAFATAATAFLVATGSPAASTLCVGGPHCFATLQAAVNTAHDGDTISVGPGTFAGGVTIPISVDVIGAGAKRTTISGGGPVLTIGTINATSEPTVSIEGVTITGGLTTNSPESQAFFGAPNVVALGGGVEVPPAANGGLGATVTITDSVISGNRAAPAATLPLGPPCPGNVNCPFARGGGGGINSWGALTLRNSVVSGNRVGGPVASDAEGAGIFGRRGPLTISDSVIEDNHATAVAPNGRFADTGGVFAQGSSLTMDDTLVTDNSASLATAMPDTVETNANSGGVHIAGDDDCVDPTQCVSGTIRDSVITGNSVTAANSAGSAVDFCGGICNDGALTLRGSTLTGNSVAATSPLADASGDSAGMGMGGPAAISDSRLVGNSVTVSAPNGTATAQAGGMSTGDADLEVTIDDTVISGNQVSAASPGGQAVVFGAGLSNGGLLTAASTTVSRNSGTASGPAGSAHGGGIWNSSFGGAPPFGTLSLSDSVVSGNTLTAHGGITPLGGGLYTDGPVTLRDVHISGNEPGNCFGVSC
jgi:hypothetical protein